MARPMSRTLKVRVTREPEPTEVLTLCSLCFLLFHSNAVSGFVHGGSGFSVGGGVFGFSPENNSRSVLKGWRGKVSGLGM
jgi:hypothetical protein